jgi:hypothetical protein
MWCYSYFIFFNYPPVSVMSQNDCQLKCVGLKKLKIFIYYATIMTGTGTVAEIFCTRPCCFVSLFSYRDIW